MNRREFFRASTAAATIGSWHMASRTALGQSAFVGREMTAAQFHAGRKFVVTEYGRIAYLDVGDGPVALFLHGFPLNSFQWRGGDTFSLHDAALYRARLSSPWVYGSDGGAGSRCTLTSINAHSISR